MSQRVSTGSLSRVEAPTISSASKRKRQLPQIPAQSKSNNSTLVAKDNETTINLTTVSELSTLTPPPGDKPHPSTREFVSPVHFVSDGEDSCVTVAVRVRPFSQRELLQEPKPIIRMHGNEVLIKSRDDVVHRFYYDHCFWSLPDESPRVGMTNGRGLSPTFATQKSVYEQLAQPLLDRSFEGYNTCLFAYGQTGSGKSYCIMGEGEAIGIVPRFAQELFERIEGSTDEENTYKVQVSYYEIYKEKIYDLLASHQNRAKKKLRVREHPVLGPYVEDLSTFVADSYPDIERWIHLGNRYRATAATGMNERSSRSHSVFTITLTQTMAFEGEESSKVSHINLIDLAGSERSSVSRTSGERLKEGASINKSLHSLGKVISLLSEKGSGRRKKVFIPYRDSTLTWLLKESLGGNSKTAMIATISPSHLHYDESLSTLRYAQQARTIVNVAKINEDPNAAIIRDLRQQIEELKVLLQGRSGGQASDDSSELKSLREKLLESEKLMASTTRSWQEKLRQSEARKQEEMEQLRRSGSLTVDNLQPNLVNLTEDPQLSEIVVYFLKEGLTTVGRRGETGHHDIELTGALVVSNHCSLSNETGTVTLHPSANTEAQTYLNGVIITTSTQLHHGDRIVLGGEYFFRFNHPLEVERGVHLKKGQGTFEYAKNELFRVQTERLEAELEERRLKEREAMMNELQSMKDAAQKDMDQQKEQYEEKIVRLTQEMTEASMEASHHLKFSEEAQAKMEELMQRNRALEEETMTQKHLIHLEKLKAEKEYEEIKESKTKLMSDLELERNKLVSDIQQLSKNKALRTSVSRRESTLSTSAVAVEPSMRGSEMVRLAMMLQEASAISKSLNKQLTFSREELTDDSGSLEVQVRVNNTQQGLVTFWSLEKFENRLEMMRDLYSNLPTSTVGSNTSLEVESVGSCEEADPFADPSDSWVKESLITPHPSPMRSASVRSLLLSGNSTHSLAITTSTSTLPPRSLLEMLNSSLASSRGGSPIVPPRVESTPQQSLATLCRQQISGLLGVTTPQLRGPVFQAVLTQVVAIKDACDVIEEVCTKQSSHGEASLSSSRSILSLYVALELLLSEGQALNRELLVWQTLLARLDCGERGLVKESADKLLETISQQTALYTSRLLQAVDSEVDREEAVKEACASLKESLDSLTQQVGSLCLAAHVMNRAVYSRLSATPTSDESLEGVGSEEFITQQPYQKCTVLFYQGYCDWCVSTFECAYESTHERVTEFESFMETSADSDLVAEVLRVIVAVETFLQRLYEIQPDVWSINSPSEGTLPLTPPLSAVVDLISHVQQVEKSVTSLTTHTLTQAQASTTSLTQAGNSAASLPQTNSAVNLDAVSSSNKQVAYCCNELAALALRVISGSPNVQAQAFVHDVQQLSHQIARAGKTLNNITKRRGERGRKRQRSHNPVEDSESKGVKSQGVKVHSEPPCDVQEPMTEVESCQEIPPKAMVDTEAESEVLQDKHHKSLLKENNSRVMVSLSPAEGVNESRTSMATGQMTRSPEHVTLNGSHVIVNKDHMTSKEDHVTDEMDTYSLEEDDSTLI